jgi:hypothetical protein
MFGYGIFLILQYALVVFAILFFFDLFLRTVKALESIAKSLESKTLNEIVKE